MAKTIVGLFDNFEYAQATVRDLTDAGFKRENISMVASDAEGKYTTDMGTEGTGEDAASGAATGAGVGAVLGGLGGLLVGLGALAIPGIGPVLAAGPLISALAGAGIGAAAGGIVGALVDLGIPEEEAGTYAEGIRRGGTLITITTSDDRADQAASIMNRHNPVDVDRRAQTWKQEEKWQGFDQTTKPYAATDIERERSRWSSMENVDRDDATFEVVEEEMRVGKREVQTGGIRARSYITEKPVEETVNLREEHVDVERRKVDRPATGTDFDAFEDQTIEMTESREEAVTDKTARVVEEVRIHKDVEERPETVRGTVRRKEVDIQDLDPNYQRDMTDYDEFEPVFRQHYTDNLSSTDYAYDDYRVAYTYGYDLANSDRFQSYDWQTVEPEARRNWERSNPDSAWDDFKDAVRQGWESMVGRSR